MKCLTIAQIPKLVIHDESTTQLFPYASCGVTVLSPLSDEYKLKVLTDLHARLTAPNPGNPLIEINDLVYGAFQILASFNQISVMFRTVLINNPSTPLVTEMNALIVLWAELYRIFPVLLRRSSDETAKAERSAQDFARMYGTFFQDDNISIGDKKREIPRIRKGLEADASQAATVVCSFNNFCKRLYGAEDNWQDIVASTEARIIITPYPHPLVSLTQKEGLKASLPESRLGSGGVSCATGMITTTYMPRTTAHNAMYSKSRTSADVLGVTFSLTSSSSEDFETIYPCLMAFPEVWATIRTELELIVVEDKLYYAHGTKTSQLFKARMNVCAQLYAILAQVLHHYDRVVGEAGSSMA
ncbi:hypothetical protein EUX98_g8753 [Antrodiella citrinella]|uniref:Uncharacterized protein n=1 Tax=Antrodiella citrinella TaxID=2447956 RepID=A0A4S4M5E8_9APHY|nr:hypothetical protein EUX98_g8753 [Antrodiella citrinella]